MVEYDFNVSRLASYVAGGVVDYNDLLSEDVAITGPLKAAQKFSTLFLTEKGTAAGDPDRGTSFVSSLRLGDVRNEFDVTAAFTNAVAEALAWLNAAQEEIDIPDDERITGAVLTSLQINAPDIKLSIEITTAAGTARVITVPVSMVPEEETVN